jgi:Group II intron, maturase-specific domain
VMERVVERANRFVRVAPKALAKMKQRVRWMTRRSCGRSLAEVAMKLRAYLVGWKGYFQLAETQGAAEGPVRGARRMDPAPIARTPAQTLEARHHEVS